MNFQTCFAKRKKKNICSINSKGFPAEMNYLKSLGIHPFHYVLPFCRGNVLLKMLVPQKGKLRPFSRAEPYIRSACLMH